MRGELVELEIVRRIGRSSRDQGEEGVMFRTQGKGKEGKGEGSIEECRYLIPNVWLVYTQCMGSPRRGFRPWLNWKCDIEKSGTCSYMSPHYGLHTLVGTV